jgi:hypothetical protein
MEEYLSKHAKHYIDEIGKNNWLSKFNEKVLPEVSEILESLIIRRILNFFFFCFRLKPNVEVKEMISQQTFEMRCLLYLVKID